MRLKKKQKTRAQDTLLITTCAHSFEAGLKGEGGQLEKEIKKRLGVPQALCEPGEEETFLSVAEGSDGRQRRTWLLCVSSMQPEIQVSGVCTHTLECRVK